jgi:Tfp pilus assembly protein PilO
VKQSKLKRVHVVAIGASVAVVLAAVLYFALISPARATITEREGEKATLEEKKAALPKAKADKAKAEADKAKALADLAKYENQYMRVGPEKAFISMADRTKAMILLWKEQSSTLAPLLARSIKSSGVRLLTPIQIPPAPTDPNVIDPNLIQIPGIQIQVSGSFPQIMQFLRSVEKWPRLVMVNNVTLSGESPQLIAQMDLTVHYLPRDSEKAQPVPTATGAGGEAGTTGGYGVPGAPGAPPGYGGYPAPGAPPANATGGNAVGGNAAGRS